MIRRAFHRAAITCLGAACVPVFAFPQSLSERVDTYFRDRPGSPFSGVVVIARGGSVLYERAYGFADAELAIPNSIASRFSIGSLTKPITATAALRLAEKGSLGLDESICEWLARCPEAWRPVTPRQLLSQQSGIPDLFGELPAAPTDSTRAVVDGAIARHMTDTLRFRPGTRYAYSNFNYILLGYALEVAGKAPWPAVLRREVFEPAVMAHTEYDDVWRILPGRVRGYELANGQLRNVRYHDHAAYTAGGLLSTAGDLLRFDAALSGGSLISDSTFRTMVTAGMGDYGLGWQVIRVFGHDQRNHTGGVTGFASHLAHYDDGTVIVVLSNTENEPARSTACDVAALVFGVRRSVVSTGESPCRATP